LFDKEFCCEWEAINHDSSQRNIIRYYKLLFDLLKERYVRDWILGAGMWWASALPFTFLLPMGAVVLMESDTPTPAGYVPVPEEHYLDWVADSVYPDDVDAQDIDGTLRWVNMFIAIGNLT
jgi:hypothetical protein